MNFKNIILLASTCATPWILSADDHSDGGIKHVYSDQQVIDKGNRGAGSTQILYHGGPIMLGTNTLYIIYYGSFPGSANNTPSIVNGFFGAVGGSPNYAVNTTYYDNLGRHIINSLLFNATKNTYYDSYSIGSNIGSNGIERIVQNTLNAGHLPLSTSAIYSVVTSPDVTGSELNNLCAFHSNMTV